MAQSHNLRAVTVVGGVAHLYQGDLDAGRVALERLSLEELARHVVLEEFSYGAVAVAQRLQELAPRKLVLVGGKQRGRAPGSVERRVVPATPLDRRRAHGAIADAVTGYIDLDLTIDVARALEALPAQTVVVEIEPATTEPSETLSAVVEDALGRALDLVRAELGQADSSTPRF